MFEILYWHWVILGILLIVIEVFTPIMLTLWFGIAALVVGGIMMFLPISTMLATAIWGLLSIALVILWFYFIKPSLARQTAADSKEAILNQKGTVISAQQASNEGVLRFYRPFEGSDEWAFLSEDEVTFGDIVIVLERLENDVLKVKRFA